MLFFLLKQKMGAALFRLHRFQTFCRRASDTPDLKQNRYACSVFRADSSMPRPASVSLRWRAFYGRGWIARAAHLKKPRRGFFPRRTVRRVDAVRIHPPSLREAYYKTETPVPGSDTGVLGGRGWIRTSSTITIRWMRFEIVMDSCAFFEFHQKSIIGYHNHLGTKTGYKVGCFARGEYSARASETAIAAVSALPSTAWLYQP